MNRAPREGNENRGLDSLAAWVAGGFQSPPGVCLRIGRDSRARRLGRAGALFCVCVFSLSSHEKEVSWEAVLCHCSL